MLVEHGKALAEIGQHRPKFSRLRPMWTICVEVGPNVGSLGPYLVDSGQSWSLRAILGGVARKVDGFWPMLRRCWQPWAGF